MPIARAAGPVAVIIYAYFTVSNVGRAAAELALEFDLVTTELEDENGVVEADDEVNQFAMPTVGHEVLNLNRFTFRGNVLQQGEVANWVVCFCPTWWEPCQQMQQPFEDLAVGWQGQLNKGLFDKKVRFAMVDCATDKVLCNEQGVDGYPAVMHYQHGSRIGKWFGGRKDDTKKVATWVDKRLGQVMTPSNMSSQQEDLAAVASRVLRQLPRLKALLPTADRLRIGPVVLLSLLGCRLIFSFMRQFVGRVGEKVDDRHLESGVELGLTKNNLSPTKSLATTQDVSVARFLPEEWAESRASIDL